MFNGDIFSDLDLTDMIQFHRHSNAKATIALTPVEDPTAYGVVELDPQSRVKCFVEKPSWERVTSNLINAGTYVLEPELLDLIPSGTFSMLERGLFPDLVEQGIPFVGYASNSYWIDIGNPQDYLKLHHDILMGKAMARFPGKSIADDIWQEAGCSIDPSARIIGPVVMGSNCTVERKAKISGPAVIGDACTIGEGATVDEAVLWQNVRLGRDTTVRNSVIGNNATIGDSSWVIDGSIVSDDSCIGSGNKLERGIRIWPGSTIQDNAVSF